MAYCVSQPYRSPLRYATTIALCIFSVGMSPILSTGRGANFRLEKIFGTRIVPIVHVQHYERLDIMSDWSFGTQSIYQQLVLDLARILR